MAEELDEQGGALTPDDGEQEPPAPLTIEGLAGEMGWVPEDRFSGPKEKWVPADEYIRKERTINRDLKSSVKKLSDRIDRMAQASEGQTKRALELQAREFKEQFATAVANKDIQGAAEAANGLANLANAVEPERDYVAEFRQRNPWFEKDEDATDLAVAISNRLGSRNVSKEDQLEMIEAEMRKKRPDLFGIAERKPPAAVAPPANGRGPAKAKGYGDLPPDVKKQMDRQLTAMADRFPNLNVDEERKALARDYWGGAQEAA